MRTKFNDFIFDSERGFFIIPNSNSTVNYRDASEDYLLQALKNTTDTTSTSMELESHIKDWPSLYHFSEKRGNIFRALDFLSHNSKVLELGAGCGAITRFLGESFQTVHAVEGNQVRASVAKERCRDLENVKVFCANIQDISFEKQYDVVTLIGVLEYAPVFYRNFNDPNDACLAMIKDALRALKPEGVLVIAIENKIGLKYWCGCKEDHTGRLFDGLHGYPIKNTPITYSKKQLANILKTAGFDFQDYYYPFPDYKLCDVVIRNVKNPEKYYLHNWLNFPFEDYNGRSFIFHEGLASRTLIKAGLFDEFANSFLVVASPTRKRTYDKPSWVVKKFAKHNSWAHRYHHIISLCETNEEVKIVRKSFSSEYDTVNGKLKFTLNDAGFVRGDLFTFSVYEALFSKDFQKSFLSLLNELKDKLLSEFHTGEMDKEGYPLLEGSAIDCTLWNLIKNENGLFFIDTKWNWLEQISIDYVLFRNLHYFLPKIYHYFDIGRDGLPDFIVSLLSKLYPSYNLNRHRENIQKENEFTHFVRGNTALTPLSSVRTSIIIVTYNSLVDIRKCIASVVNNTSFPYEIIVIDNASSDGTQEYLKTLKNAKIILNSTNNGFSKGCNQGIQIAKGDYVVLLNPDTMVTQGWDAHLISHFKEGIGAVGPVSNYVAGLQKIELYFKENLSGQIDINVLENKLYHQNKGKSTETKLLIGFCMMLKREVIEKVGMVDEDLFLGNDDLDMSLRLRNNGYRLLVATDTFIYHKGQASFKSEPSAKTKAFVQESTDVLYKKLQKQYGPYQVPSPQELWGIDWFKPSEGIRAENKLTSIVILAHNQLDYTKKCIESIFKYTRDPFELIVVDNGSTDGTVQYLENLRCKYGVNSTDQQIEASKSKRRKKKKGKKKKTKKIVPLNKTCTFVTVIRNEENLGFAAGNNQGMAIAKGNFILLMNNDLVVTQGWLNRMISCAERSPKIGIVGPMSNYVSGPQLVKEVSYDTTSLASLNKYAKKFAEDNADQTKLFLRVVGFCMLIKRAVIDKIGGLDDRYGLGNFEDDDFSLRAALAGFESWIAEDCFVHHFGSRTFIGAKIDYRESLHKNWEIFKKKWGLPQDLNYGSSYTISHIQNDGFDPDKHYCPLAKNDILSEKPDTIPGSPGEIYGGIQPIFAKGQHEKAIITLEKLLESYPDFALAHNDLGVLYFNKHEKEKALNHYQKAVQLEPNNITFQKNLSDFHYVELGRLEEALQGYVHVLSINPKDVETLLIVGHICVALHKFDDAKVFYSKVLEIEPENVDARQNLDKLTSGQLPVVSGQPEQGRVALKPTSFFTNREDDKKNKNMESHQETSNKNIRASIIIPILNKQEFIKKCVKSIQEHTSVPYEIIFVSKGAKSDILKWLRSLVKENVNYQLVELGKGDNFARCYNKGIEASFGGYIVLLHGDVVVTKGWLTGLLECVKNAPNAGIFGPMTNNGSGVQKVSDSDDISLDHLEEFAKSFRQRNRYCRVPSRKLSEFCLLFRRELVGKIGPFDESLGQSNLEVDDICLRATIEGYRNIIAGDVFVYKYDGPKLIGNKKSFTEKWNGIDAQSTLGKRLLALKAIEKAVELDEKGRLNDAVKILSQGIAHVPDEKRLYHALAEMLINNKQYKDALDALNELPPDDQDVKKLELTGYCMEGMEQYKEAEEYADHALSLDTASALALNLKGVLAYRQGDNSIAEDFFRRAIASDPGFGESYTNLGALKWAMEDQEEALDLYERGFILSPTIMDIVTIYHSSATDLGAFEKAEPVFRDAITLHPQNRRLKYLSIDILIKQGNHDLAIEEIEGAMVAFGIDDGLLSAALKVREALGPVEIDEKSKKKGTISLCMIVKNEEQHLAKCLKSLKPVVDEMIVVDTGSTDMTRDIAKVFGAKVYNFEWRDDFSEARNYSISKASGDWLLVMDADEVISPSDYGALRKLVKKSTSRSVAYSFVTRNYSTRANTIGWTVNDGKYGTEEAGSGWMPSTKVRLFHNVSPIRFEYPVHEKVEPALKKSGIEIKKCNIPIHHYGQLNEKKFDLKGEAYYDMGRKKLEKLGDDVVAIRELAVQAGGLEKHNEAIELWQRLVAIKPDMSVAYVNMGTAYLKLGKYEEALLSAKKAVEFEPNMKEALNNYALCQLYLGNVRQAIPTLEKLMKQEPEYLSAQFVLAAAYCCDGKMKRGLGTFEKLRHTITGPGLAVACHDLAKKLVSAQRLEYAISLLGAAIEGKYANKDVLSLLSECKRTDQESVNHIDSASVCPIQFGDTQLHSNSVPLR